MSTSAVRQYFAPLIHAQTRVLVGFGAFTLLPAMFLVVGGLAVAGPWLQRVPMVAIGALLTWPGVRLLRRGLGGAQRHPALRVLLERPSSVVWVFPLRHKSHGVHHVASDLVVCTRRGKQLRIPCPPLGEDRALEVVAGLVPHAAIGFTDERQRVFKRDPSQLGQHIR